MRRALDRQSRCAHAPHYASRLKFEATLDADPGIRMPFLPVIGLQHQAFSADNGRSASLVAPNEDVTDQFFCDFNSVNF
jgi:hypothetical protein